MKILCVKDVTCLNLETCKLDREKSFSEGKIYEAYPFKGKTQLYANDDREVMHCIGELNDKGALENTDTWFEEHFKVIFV